MIISSVAAGSTLPQCLLRWRRGRQDRFAALACPIDNTRGSGSAHAPSSFGPRRNRSAIAVSASAMSCPSRPVPIPCRNAPRYPILLLTWLWITVVPGLSAQTVFETSGDVTVTVDPAAASLTKNRRGIRTLNITSAPASVRKLGKSYSANLFFSREFDPKPGKYPVAFSYLNKKNTLGGSFYGGGLFSHDTKGEAEFLEFGEQVKVRFQFTTYDKSEGSEGRRTVTVKGEAVCARGDIF